MMMDYGDVMGAVKIKDGLFIGDAFAANDIDFKELNKVTHVINCSGRDIQNMWEQMCVKYLTYYWHDSETQVILDSRDVVINEVHEFIQEALNMGESVLIHSTKGQSRSCIVIVAYLMKQYNWNFSKAMQFMSSRRPDIKLKPSFQKQLTDFESRLIKQGVKLSKEWNSDHIQELSSEEFVLQNTYINASQPFRNHIQEDPTYNWCGPPEVKSKLRWADNNIENDRHRLEQLEPNTGYLAPAIVNGAAYNSKGSKNGGTQSIGSMSTALTVQSHKIGKKGSPSITDASPKVLKKVPILSVVPQRLLPPGVTQYTGGPIMQDNGNLNGTMNSRRSSLATALQNSLNTSTNSMADELLAVQKALKEEEARKQQAEEDKTKEIAEKQRKAAAAAELALKQQQAEEERKKIADRERKEHEEAERIKLEKEMRLREIREREENRQKEIQLAIEREASEKQAREELERTKKEEEEKRDREEKRKKMKELHAIREREEKERAQRESRATMDREQQLLSLQEQERRRKDSLRETDLVFEEEKRQAANAYNKTGTHLVNSTTMNTTLTNNNARSLPHVDSNSLLSISSTLSDGPLPIFMNNNGNNNSRPSTPTNNQLQQYSDTAAQQRRLDPFSSNSSHVLNSNSHGISTLQRLLPANQFPITIGGSNVRAGTLNSLRGSNGPVRGRPDLVGLSNLNMNMQQVQQTSPSIGAGGLNSRLDVNNILGTAINSLSSSGSHSSSQHGKASSLNRPSSATNRNGSRPPSPMNSQQQHQQKSISSPNSNNNIAMLRPPSPFFKTTSSSDLYVQQQRPRSTSLPGAQLKPTSNSRPPSPSQQRGPSPINNNLMYGGGPSFEAFGNSSVSSGSSRRHSFPGPLLQPTPGKSPFAGFSVPPYSSFESGSTSASALLGGDRGLRIPGHLGKRAPSPSPMTQNSRGTSPKPRWRL